MLNNKLTPNPKSKPTEEWTKQNWFASSEDTKEFSSKFPISGKSLSGLTQEDFRSVTGDVQGISLYNAIQNLKLISSK